jgi:cardiolipin synthase A/B
MQWCASTGCLAHNLQSAFCELWAFCTGEVLTGDAVFPPDIDDDSDSDVVSCGVISSPSSEEHPLRLFFFLTFLAARERLWITTPYFVPDKHTREVVKRRARAGCDVRILMPNEHTDAKPISVPATAITRSCSMPGFASTSTSPP